MKDVAALISALASFLWPLFAFTILVVFKKEIGTLLTRMKKGKLLGQEIELSETLDNLEFSASVVAEEAASLPQQRMTDETLESKDDDPSRLILSEAAKSPTVALLMLASELEREARQLMASIGRVGNNNTTLAQAVETLQKFGGLPEHITGSLKLFSDVRNRLVHARQAEDDEILRAIDSGLTILKALRVYPVETNYVYRTDIEVFQDPECTLPWMNVKGVILKTQSPGKTIFSYRIFPTTRTHFQPGKRVAWEWNLNLVWNDAWYKDPESGEIKLAWNSSAEFIGRHLDDI